MNLAMKVSLLELRELEKDDLPESFALLYSF
jgi:hypothetical protein